MVVLRQEDCTEKIEIAAQAVLSEIAAIQIGEEPKLSLLENRVLETLELVKTALIKLSQSREQEQYQQIVQQHDRQLQQLAAVHKEMKQQRDRDRTHYRQHLQGNALTAALADLTKASQRDSTERRKLKHEKESAISPLAKLMVQSEQSIRTLKRYYTGISSQWQAQMQLAYSVPENAIPLPIIYQDEFLMVIDKPAGLLSVPGRKFHLQDSVTSRLKHQLPAQTFLQPVHRLDQATSGLLAIALSPQIHRALSQQFAQRQVCKNYEAILSAPVSQTKGTIELPISPDAANRPKQIVDFQQGKPSRTDFKLITPGEHPRIAFSPHTGRTHQIRVHAAHPKGLNAPILGDVLYGDERILPKKRQLYLHATFLCFTHPITKDVRALTSNVPY